MQQSQCWLSLCLPAVWSRFAELDRHGHAMAAMNINGSMSCSKNNSMCCEPGWTHFQEYLTVTKWLSSNIQKTRCWLEVHVDHPDHIEVSLPSAIAAWPRKHRASAMRYRISSPWENKNLSNSMDICKCCSWFSTDIHRIFRMSCYQLPDTADLNHFKINKQAIRLSRQDSMWPDVKIKGRRVRFWLHGGASKEKKQIK